MDLDLLIKYSISIMIKKYLKSKYVTERYKEINKWVIKTQVVENTENEETLHD